MLQNLNSSGYHNSTLLYTLYVIMFVMCNVYNNKWGLPCRTEDSRTVDCVTEDCVTEDCVTEN